jgi:SlyX protein
MDTERIERIETRVAFQEQSIQELSDTIYRQEKQIAVLEAAVTMLRERVGELAEAVPEPARDETPPHY